MERDNEGFDAAGFLELLRDSLRERWHDQEVRTGVLSFRVHLRDGEPWAVSVEFDDARDRAA